MLRNKGVGGTKFVMMLQEVGVVKMGDFRCYVITGWPQRS